MRSWTRADLGRAGLLLLVYLAVLLLGLGVALVLLAADGVPVG